MKKRIIAAILAAATLLCLASCGGEKYPYEFASIVLEPMSTTVDIYAHIKVGGYITKTRATPDNICYAHYYITYAFKDNRITDKGWLKFTFNGEIGKEIYCDIGTIDFNRLEDDWKYVDHCNYYGGDDDNSQILIEKISIKFTDGTAGDITVTPNQYYNSLSKYWELK